jgi:hypothetical protein
MGEFPCFPFLSDPESFEDGLWQFFLYYVTSGARRLQERCRNFTLRRAHYLSFEYAGMLGRVGRLNSCRP